MAATPLLVVLPSIPFEGLRTYRPRELPTERPLEVLSREPERLFTLLGADRGEGAGDRTDVDREGGVLTERLGAGLGAVTRDGALCRGATDRGAGLWLGATLRDGTLWRGATLREGALSRGATDLEGTLLRSGVEVRVGAW